MLQTEPVSETLSLGQARGLIKNLFRVRPEIYWADFLLTYGLGIYCFGQVRGASLWQPHPGLDFSARKVFFFFASCLLFYRAAMFIHEVVHQRAANRLPLFRLAWNLLCGIPFLVPSFVYYTHIDHHRRKHYGTRHDGEYLPLEHQRRWFILFYLSWSFVIPVLAVVRFFLLTPLCWLMPPLRGVIHRHASSMVMDPTYIRPLPSRQTMRLIYWQELGCFLWCLGVALYPQIAFGRWPLPFLLHAYATGVVIILMNSVRTLGSHRWRNRGEAMSFSEQFSDSVNYPHAPWLSELWGPVGTRFHALHHLFPTLPYHALPEAHRRLMKELPAGSLYRHSEATSLTASLRDLWRRAQTDRRSLSSPWR